MIGVIILEIETVFREKETDIIKKANNKKWYSTCMN